MKPPIRLAFQSMKANYLKPENIAYSKQTVDNYSGKDAVGPGNFAPNAISTNPLINLHVSAQNLADVDIITVSDPMCVLYLSDKGQWREFARSEVVWNNLNPQWVKFFTIEYIFEVRQPLMFRVYDVDSDKADLSKQTLIGEAVTELSTIVSSHSGCKLDLRIPSKDKSRGTLIITSDQVENCMSMVEGLIYSKKLKKSGVFSSNSPFFVLSKSTESGMYVPVYQSEVEKKMKWKPFSISYSVLCNIDPDRPIRVSFYNYRSHKAAKLIGYHDTTYVRLSESINQTIQLVDDRGKDAGSFTVQSLSIRERYSFYDFIRAGLELNLVTAIDFTASNGQPQNPRSLHYMNPTGDGINQYEACIRAVGEILCPYDTDQNFPVIGFGAKVGGVTQHCFPLTFNPNDHYVKGLEGILGAYAYALRNVTLHGPTLFSHVIRYASNLAVNSPNCYTILLIVTDGIINDMADTVDAIVDAGRIPLSIIIVGVGDADFSAMDFLDADDVPLVSRSGHTMVRDLVQFVPFNKFRNQHYSILAAEVLEEVPRQVVEWAELNNIRPSNLSQI